MGGVYIDDKVVTQLRLGLVGYKFLSDLPERPESYTNMSVTSK